MLSQDDGSEISSMNCGKINSIVANGKRVVVGDDLGELFVWEDDLFNRRLNSTNEEGIKNTIIADNTGGILMQRGEVDMCIVGTDRTLANGDVCNKVGTYLKALAAHDNNIPFYVALPSSTIDWNLKNYKDIPIEERNSQELSHMEGVDRCEEGR